MTSESKDKKLYKLPSLAEALAAAEQMQQDWLEYGSDFVHLYIEDTDGDWLEQWGEDEESAHNETGEPSSILPERRSMTPIAISVLKFLVSDDPVAIEARPFWENRPLPEIAAHLERCLTLPESDRPYAVQDLLILEKNTNARSNFINKNHFPESLELAESLVGKLMNLIV
jgi:hypothetical protein